MKKRILSCLSSLPLLLSITASASESCQDVTSCAELVSKLTGEKYIWPKNIENYQFKASSNVEWNKANASQLFSLVLNQNELTRIPVDAQTYEIATRRDALQRSIIVLEGSKENPPKLPDTYDVVTLKYKMVDQRMADTIARFLVDLVSRNGRVSSYPDSSMLVMTESAKNLTRIVEILKDIDKPMSKEAVAEIERRKQARRSNTKNGQASSSRK